MLFRSARSVAPAIFPTSPSGELDPSGVLPPFPPNRSPFSPSPPHPTNHRILQETQRRRLLTAPFTRQSESTAASHPPPSPFPAGLSRSPRLHARSPLSPSPSPPHSRSAAIRGPRPRAPSGASLPGPDLAILPLARCPSAPSLRRPPPQRAPLPPCADDHLRPLLFAPTSPLCRPRKGASRRGTR